ncbi:uncharacterized protein TOT_030000466 [Theileria orientalis strain Shintoku]|uniref:3'-5' exonuclease domain-containing protein n=1 Tax=Theileria orientalis strain Shintoku TaxID=869250 RepID=J4C8Q6_THEOR|nr:uncharacterized protein TOT_030000466 [Theileria orientalis strain Shintoku]BAM41203.1 uncharacterized protein TOT_030000466 [Theileria orientalis strain Shintoku]|eukprot:XP_009691504.1 uncharacterized protein TOT_030000466 [Theileria orientalis strain Shintoku]
MDLFVDAIDSKIHSLEEYQELVKIRTSNTKSDSNSSKNNNDDSKKGKNNKSPQNLVEPSDNTEVDNLVPNPTEKSSEEENGPVPFLNSLVDSCTHLVRTTNLIFTDEDRNILSEKSKQGKISEIYKACQRSIQIIHNIVKKVAPDYVYDKGTSAVDVLLDEIKNDFKRLQIPMDDDPAEVTEKRLETVSVSKKKSKSSKNELSEESDKLENELSEESDKLENELSEESDKLENELSEESDKLENELSEESDEDNSESKEEQPKEDPDAKNENNLTKKTLNEDEDDILSEHSFEIDLKNYKLPPRPQDKWKSSIDNFTTIPHINKRKKKYNKVLPQIIYNKEDVEQRFFKKGFVPQIYPRFEQLRMVSKIIVVNRHPYMQELNSLEWSEEKLDSTHQGYNILGGEWNLLEKSEPLELGESKYKMVLTEEDLKAMIEKIQNNTILSIDVEHWSKNTYRGIVCLIQLSTPEENYIVDPFDIFTKLNILNVVTTDPRILKVMHGSDNDIEWLQRDFGVYIVNMFDTRQAAKVLNLKEESLMKLIDKYFNVKMNKKYQLADWSKRPLDEEMLNYACSDSNYLIPLYIKMKNEILSTSDGKVKMIRVMNYSKNICLTQYVDNGVEMYRKFIRITKKNKIERKSMSFVQYNFMLNLLEFRNYAARKLDVSEQMVIRDYQLGLLVKKLLMGTIFEKIIFDFMKLVHHEIPKLVEIKNALCLVRKKLNNSILTLKEPQSIQFILDFLNEDDKKLHLDEVQKMKNTKCIDNTLKVYNKFVANGLFNNTSTMQTGIEQEKPQSKVEEILEKRSLVEEANIVEDWKRKRFNM